MSTLWGSIQQARKHPLDSLGFQPRNPACREGVSRPTEKYWHTGVEPKTLVDRYVMLMAAVSGSLRLHLMQAGFFRLGVAGQVFQLSGGSYFCSAVQGVIQTSNRRCSCWNVLCCKRGETFKMCGAASSTLSVLRYRKTPNLNPFFFLYAMS